MTKEEKFNQLVDTLNTLGKQVKADKVAMSEANEETPQISLEEQIQDIHSFLFATDNVEEELIQEEEVAMSASDEDINASISAVAEATKEEPKAEAAEANAEGSPAEVSEEVKAEAEPAIEAKAEETPEAKAEDVVDYKAMFEKQKKEIEALKAQAAATENKPELVHNPEADVKQEGVKFGSPNMKKAFNTPQDSVFAALANS